MKNSLLCWLKMFIIWAIIIFIASLAIEYAWFGSFLFVTSTIPIFNMVVASSIMYAIFFGFVFATAQFVMRPQLCSKPMPSYYAPAKSTMVRSKPKAKKTAKKSKKKGKKKRKR